VILWTGEPDVCDCGKKDVHIVEKLRRIIYKSYDEEYTQAQPSARTFGIYKSLDQRIPWNGCPTAPRSCKHSHSWTYQAASLLRCVRAGGSSADRRFDAASTVVVTVHRVQGILHVPHGNEHRLGDLSDR